MSKFVEWLNYTTTCATSLFDTITIQNIFALVNEQTCNFAVLYPYKPWNELNKPWNYINYFFPNFEEIIKK